MTSTLENINTNITARGEALFAILQIYNEYDFDNVTVQLVQSNINILATTTVNYELMSLQFLCDYYANKTNPSARASICRKYMNYIIADGVIDSLRLIYEACLHLQRLYTVDAALQVKRLFAIYNKSHISIVFTSGVNNVCMCGSQFALELKTSEHVCRVCGITEKLRGMSFEDSHVNSGMTGRSGHGRYDTNKHCKATLDKIQARERVQIPQNVIDRVKRHITKNRIMNAHITCASMRRYLKTLGLSKYNEHIPLLWSIITGNQLVQLTEDEQTTFYSSFAQIIQIYNVVKPAGKSNCPYYPYFIYKILELQLSTARNRRRKRKILSCIHLQSRETLIENDRIWRRIVKVMQARSRDKKAGWRYIPTKPR